MLAKGTIGHRATFVAMSGRSTEQAKNDAKRKRSLAAKRGWRRVRARQAAWRRIVEESGVTPTEEGMAALWDEIRGK